MAAAAAACDNDAVLSEVHTDTVAIAGDDGRVVSRFTAWLEDDNDEGDGESATASSDGISSAVASGVDGAVCAAAVHNKASRDVDVDFAAPAELAESSLQAPDGACATQGTPPDIGVDDDGDVVVRRQKRRRVQLVVPHAMATSIADVGLQVWAGALLLADFLADRARRGGLPRAPTTDRLVGLELGGGTGLTSVAACALGGFDKVYCTDVGSDVLGNCARAAAANGVAEAPSGRGHGVAVRELDWCAPPRSLVGGVGGNGVCVDAPKGAALGGGHSEAPPPSTPPADGGRKRAALATAHADPRAVCDAGTRGGPTASSFAWTDADAACFREEVTVLLAADTVYLDDATTAFGECALRLLATPGPPRVMYLALQKRINFSLDELAVVAPAHDHFVRNVVGLEGLRAERLPVDFPQVFAYTRTPQLELWRFTAAAAHALV